MHKWVREVSVGCIKQYDTLSAR